MKELVEVLAQALVDHPEEVEVAETETENEILLELKGYESFRILNGYDVPASSDS